MTTGSARTAAYLLLACLLALAVRFRLGSALAAGLISYTILDIVHRKLAVLMRPRLARWIALAAFIVASIVIILLSAHLLRQSLKAVPVILAKIMPKIFELASRYAVELPFNNVEELRQVALDSLKENLTDVTHASGLVTKRVFGIIIAIFIPVMAFMDSGRAPLGGDQANAYTALALELRERLRRFMASFERVLAAQATISAINTALTAIFLAAIGMPHKAFLIPATFFLGLLPVIGNVLSNSIIVAAGLTISPRDAALALGFLILIHKGEYFLNSRIVGSSIDAPMWQTLLGIFIGEIVLGVPGIIIAPAMLHFLRGELEEIPVA